MSLKRATERRAFMEAQLKRLAMPYQFVDAVDAALLTEAETHAINSRRKYINPLKKGEIACTMSHAKACEEFLRGEGEHGLIAEDDVILGAWLPHVLKSLERCAPPGAATLLFSPIHRPVLFRQVEAIDEHFYRVSPESAASVFGAQAYFVTKQAAVRLLAGFLPVRSIADDWQRYLDLRLLTAINLVYPFPVLHAEFLSVINPASGRLGLRTKIKKFFYYNRVFPFYQLFLLVRRRAAERRQRRNILAPDCRVTKTYRI